jgi:hypothetical protein
MAITSLTDIHRGSLEQTVIKENKWIFYFQ